MNDEVLLVVSTFESGDEARRIGRQLVEEKLAACVNLLPGVESIYQWQGQVTTGTEVLAFIKTTVERYQMLEARIRALHSYKVPEVLSFRVADGLPDYLRWVAASCGQ